MKLKNWKKIAEDETSILWELISDPSQEVMVTKEPEGRSWYVDTPFGELSVAESKEKAKQKAISWMEKHPQIREKDIAKKFITDIVVDENLSLLVNGPLSFLKDVLKTTRFEMSCEALKEALEEVLEETQSNEVRQLLKELSEKKEDLDVYRREQQQMKKRMCERRRLISKKRSEVQRAELETNEDLEGKTIMIESSKYTSGESMVLCHIKGDPKRKLQFKPNWFQKQKLLSWELAPEEWPLEVDVVRSPKKKFFIFIKPVKLNAFFFNGKYLFREFPSVKQKKNV